MILSISPQGRMSVEPAWEAGTATVAEAIERRIREAFGQGTAHGLLHLATVELETRLPDSFRFARDWGHAYLTQLCHRPDGDIETQPWSVPLPPIEERAEIAGAVPPMRGAEYLNADVLERWWLELDALVRDEVVRSDLSVQRFLAERNPLWRMVGRVTFHLAENKRDPVYPFAFLATYSSRLSARGRLQHQPLERALREYGAAKNRAALLSLLEPIQQASERVAWVKETVESGEVYQPMAWHPGDAYRFLESIPELEASGLMVRVPDWWKAMSPPRPVVNVKIGEGKQSKLTAESLLDFQVDVTLEGEPLSEREIEALLASAGGLVSLRGKWVELDRDKLAGALAHWKQVEREAESGGISFFQGMRLLAGADLGGDAVAAVPDAAREWAGIHAGARLEQVLREWCEAETSSEKPPETLLTTLRPYQQTGVHWLRFVARMGLGACGRWGKECT